LKEAFEKGLAVGIQQIRTDSVFFRFKDETWEFPTGVVLPKYAHYNGSYYEAKASRLRKLAKEQANG
jgi:hypothetical protein